MFCRELWFWISVLIFSSFSGSKAMANWVYWIYWIFLDGRRLTEGTLYIGRLFFADKISTTRNGVAVGFVLVCSVGHWLSGSVFFSSISSQLAKILRIESCILSITQSKYALPSPSFLAVPLYVEQGLKDSASQDWTAVQVVSSVGIVNWSLCLVSEGWFHSPCDCNSRPSLSLRLRIGKLSSGDDSS